MSIDAQRTAITRYCAALGYELVGEALDENVSGVVSPFKRPSLGRWLTNKPPRQYEVLVAFHMSRVSRSARDALELVEWLEAHGKTLVTVGDGV
ncbi:recombinase family protein, partial [Algoriphagus aestuarii]|nr:recombinase family protein [Algoriphagus aestuarii]